MKQKFLSLFMTLCLSAGLCVHATLTPPNCGAAGTDGDNLTWAVDKSVNFKYVLTITGSGPMADFEVSSIYTNPIIPWNSDRSWITEVNLPEGLTSIGNCAIYGTLITSLNIPAAVTRIGEKGLWSNIYLESISLPEGLQEIGYWAFKDCKKITTLSIPANVNSIAYGITSGCSELTSISVDANNAYYESPTGINAIISKTAPITLLAACNNTPSIPSNVKVIDQYAFCGMRNITSMTFPASLERIECGAFMQTGLTSIHIPAAVNYIDLAAFAECPFETFTVDPNNEKYYIPENTNALVDNSTHQLLLGCKNTVIPASVTSIAGNAFNGISGLTSLSIPSNVTTIGSTAFANCPDLVSIDLPENLTVINAYMFTNCTSLTSLTIPASVTKIRSAFVAGCTSLQTITCLATTPPDASETDFGSTGSAVFNMQQVGTPTKFAGIVYVPAASVNAYKAADGWKDLDIRPIGVEGPQPCEDTDAYRGTCGENLNWVLTCDGELVITGTGAMYDYEYPNYGPWHAKRTEIKSISLPDGLTSIGKYAFYMMDEMNTAVVVPEGVTSIGYCAFSGDRKMPAITLPNSLTTLASSVFAEDNSLTSLTIPANVNSIGTMLTRECNALESITVAEGNTTFASPYDCNAIIKKSTHTLVAGCKTTVIPLEVTTIGVGAFSSIKTLTEIKLPKGVTTLGDYCFEYCTTVKTLNLPTTVENISGTAFTGCVFTAINVVQGNPKFDSRDNCNAIIETATNTLVKGCETTVIPDGVVALGDGAFMSCKGLKFINIPANVNLIDHNALIYCNKLEAITCFATTPPTADNLAFNYGEPSIISINPAIPVYVPAGSINAYRSAANWNYFTNFVPLTDKYTIKALANHGTVTGTGTYASGTEVTLTAVPDAGYEFKQWSDGTTNNPKSIIVSKDMTVRAMFETEGTEEEDSEVEAVTNPEDANAVIISVAWVNDVHFFVIDLFKNGLFELEVIFDINGDPILTPSSPAPSRYNIRKSLDAPDYLYVNISGIEFGQQYTYTLDAYNEYDICIAARSGSFNTPCENCLQDNASADEITELLDGWEGETMDVSIVRSMQRNGYYNTLCVPFSMTASQIANSSLDGAVIKEFSNAQVIGDELQITLTQVTEIEAGKPYFIKYSAAEALDQLNFEDVEINSADPEGVTYNGVTMIGTYVPTAVAAQSSATDGAGVLFLGPNNQLYWPNTAGTIKPFRAYFTLSLGSGAPIRRGMPARIIEAANTATGVENIDAQPSDAASVKVIENGALYIIRNGEKYNAMGQIIK